MIEIPHGALLSFADADARLDGALIEHFNEDYDVVLFVAGNLTVDGDFVDGIRDMYVVDRADVPTGGGPTAARDENQISYMDTVYGESDLLVAITGDLTVSGRLGLPGPSPALYVGGHTRAETLETGDGEVRLHDASLAYLVYGYHNDTYLRADTVHTPWLIRERHGMDLAAPGAIVVENIDRHGEANITCAEIPAVFVPEVIDAEYQNIDAGRFVDRLRAGLPVLLPGVRVPGQHAPGKHSPGERTPGERTPDRRTPGGWGAHEPGMAPDTSARSSARRRMNPGRHERTTRGAREVGPQDPGRRASR